MWEEGQKLSHCDQVTPTGILEGSVMACPVSESVFIRSSSCFKIQNKENKLCGGRSCNS